jgi:hypothetical protein
VVTTPPRPDVGCSGAQIKALLGCLDRQRFICRFAVPQATIASGAFGRHACQHGLLGIYIVADCHLLLNEVYMTRADRITFDPAVISGKS